MEALFQCVCGHTEQVYIAGGLASVDCENCGLVAEVDAAEIENQNVDGLPVVIGPENELEEV